MRSPSSCQLALISVGSLIVFLLVISLGTGHVPASISPSRNLQSSPHPASLDKVYNNTLGFQKLFVLNVPDRSDHRDALTLTGALTGLDFDWIDGVRGDSIPDNAFPPGNGQRFSLGGRGSWRAHMNALRAIIDQNLASAVIFEDDVDWDIRIKDQLYDFAMSARALMQPLATDSTRFADPSFPLVLDPEFQPKPIPFKNLPTTVEPRLTPYGDHWDVLWLGHCGMRRSQVGLIERWAKPARKVPKGYVVHENDPTVPQTQHIHVYDDDGHPRFRQDFANHTRVVHHAMDGICSLAYAVTQAGARQLLYELAVLKFDDLFDIMLREFCDGQNGHEKHNCLTVQPTLFNHHRLAGARSRDSEIQNVEGPERELAFTNDIRWSTRLNAPKLLKGERDYDDQFPDATG